jgi:hypothetical protein
VTPTAARNSRAEPWRRLGIEDRSVLKTQAASPMFWQQQVCRRCRFDSLPVPLSISMPITSPARRLPRQSSQGARKYGGRTPRKNFRANRTAVS